VSQTADEVPVLQGRLERTVLIGTSAPGLLESTLVTEAGQTRPDQYIVRLTAPLVAGDGVQVLPAATRLVVRLQSVSAVGLVRLTAVAALTERNGSLQQIDLAEGAVIVRGPNGQPLIARDLNDRGAELASMDTGLAAMSGVKRLGELLNRPQSQSFTSNTAGVSATTVNGEVNAPAAFLEGAFDVLTRQVTARNNRATNEILRRARLWTLPAQTPVEIYINRSMNL
jgi:hypothetical protein